MRGTLATTTCALALVVMALLPAPCHAVTSSTGAVHARQSLRLAKRPRLDWSTSGGAVGNVAQMPASPYAMAEARLATDDTVPADLVASFDNFDDDYDMDHDATPVVARPADMADRVGGDLPLARILDLVDHRTFARYASIECCFRVALTSFATTRRTRTSGFTQPGRGGPSLGYGSTRARAPERVEHALESNASARRHAPTNGH